jgi:hypothetical protein
MMGNALNPRGAGGNNAASGLSGLLRPQNNSNNNAAGGLANMMSPQGMQGAMSAAQRMMGMGRRLQQFGPRASQMAVNNMRSQAATSQVRIHALLTAVLHSMCNVPCIVFPVKHVFVQTG